VHQVGDQSRSRITGCEDLPDHDKATQTLIRKYPLFVVLEHAPHTSCAMNL